MLEYFRMSAMLLALAKVCGPPSRGANSSAKKLNSSSKISAALHPDTRCGSNRTRAGKFISSRLSLTVHCLADGAGHQCSEPRLGCLAGREYACDFTVVQDEDAVAQRQQLRQVA